MCTIISQNSAVFYFNIESKWYIYLTMFNKICIIGGN